MSFAAQVLRFAAAGLALLGTAHAEAITVRSGSIDHRLSLPDAFCTFDESQPADRNFVEITRKGMAEAEKQASAKRSQQSPNAGTQSGLLPSLDPQLFTTCDQRADLRAGKLQSPTTIGIAILSVTQDPSANAGLVYAVGFMCSLFAKNAEKEEGLPLTDYDGRLRRAYDRLQNGQSSSLPVIAKDALWCTNLGVVVGTNADQSSPKRASLRFLSMAWLPNWQVQLMSFNQTAASLDELVQSLENEKKTLRSIVESDFSKK